MTTDDLFLSRKNVIHRVHAGSSEIQGIISFVHCCHVHGERLKADPLEMNCLIYRVHHAKNVLAKQELGV